LRLFSFGGYGLALAALALVVFGAYDSYPNIAGNLRSSLQTCGGKNVGCKLGASNSQNVHIF